MCNCVIRCAITEEEQKQAIRRMHAAIRDRSVGEYAIARVALTGRCVQASQDA